MKADMKRTEREDELLHKMLHLKRYESPEIARMTRNRQNIMRQVRAVSVNKRKSFSDLLEINFPWFFAEPKYGVAMLFVAFAGLQYLGVNTRQAVNSDPGIYTTTTDRFAEYRTTDVSATNAISYPAVPDGLRLFPEGRNTDEIKWINYWKK